MSSNVARYQASGQLLLMRDETLLRQGRDASWLTCSRQCADSSHVADLLTVFKGHVT